MIGDLISAVSSWMIDVITKLGYLGVLLGMILNSAGIPIPSEVIAGFSGYLVYQGDLNLILVGLVAAVGNVVGGTISYLLGLKGGRPAIQKYGKYVRITEEKFEKVQKWFNRYGDEMVLLGQFIPIFRSYVSLPAGVLKVPLKKFLPYTFIGSFIWITLITFLSSRLGENWIAIGEYMRKFQYVIAAVIIAGVIYLVYKYVKSFRKR